MFGIDDIVKGLSSGTVEGIGSAVDKIVQDFKMPPDKMAEWEQKKADLAANLQIQMEQTAEKDRESARQREVTVKDKTPANLAYFLTCGFFGLLAFMVSYPLPTGSERVIDMMLGSLGTAWLAAIYYYYGTSAGSDKKHDLIDKLVTHG